MPNSIVTEAKEVFADAIENESDNRARMLEDVRFVHASDHWPADVRAQRELEHRPCLTINKLPSFVRQVVNDARQNRPAIKVSPVDDLADPPTGKVLSGLVRHIERNSDADVAYDTSVEWAVSAGLGYFTIETQYADDNGFEQELAFRRVVSPFSIYADPESEAADSSDWKRAIQIISGEPEALKELYGVDADFLSWGDGGTGDVLLDDEARLARYWKVTTKGRDLVLLSNGGTMFKDEITPDLLELGRANGITVVEGRSRRVMLKEVNCYLLSGDDQVKDEKWPGRYIPIVPVYGAEFWIDGKRQLKSLIHDGMDAQRQFNFWRSATTELVALAPKAPYIGPAKAFVTDIDKWNTANTKSHAFIRHDGDIMPQRQPFAGVPAGALQEALNASDDMKTVIGMYDASLGARSNETSGTAIRMRQREGDINTFHFQDNLVRAIRHAGRILVDMIPKVYDKARVVRILGEDGKAEQVAINQPTQVQDEDTGAAIERIYDVTTGRYDVTVTAGPSFTTQRQEAAAQMTELIRAFPDAAPVLGDLLAKNLDWPEADEVAKRLEKLNGGGDQAQPQTDPGQVAIAQAKAQEAQANAQIKQLDAQMKMADVRIAEIELEQKKVELANAQSQAIRPLMSPAMPGMNPPGAMPPMVGMMQPR